MSNDRNAAVQCRIGTRGHVAVAANDEVSAIDQRAFTRRDACITRYRDVAPQRDVGLGAEFEVAEHTQRAVKGRCRAAIDPGIAADDHIPIACEAAAGVDGQLARHLHFAAKRNIAPGVDARTLVGLHRAADTNVASGAQAHRTAGVRLTSQRCVALRSAHMQGAQRCRIAGKQCAALRVNAQLTVGRHAAYARNAAVV